MKKLIIVRHAKTENNLQIDDFLRELTDKGIGDCYKLAGEIKASTYNPEKIIASSAARTKKTAEIIKANLSPQIEIELMTELYQANPEVILETIKNLKDDYDSVMIVAHNPAVQELTCLLAQQSEQEMQLQLKLGFYPASAAFFVFPNSNSWKDMEGSNAKLDKFYTP